MGEAGLEDSGGPGLVDLAGDVARLSGRLAEEQLALLVSEARQELRKAGAAVLAGGVGAALLASGAVLSTLTLVHLLHRATRLPLWACYGLAAGTAGAAGAGLLAAARAEAAAVRLPALPETAKALRENVAWLKEQLTPEAP